MSSRRDIRLPALSATMEEATILEWKVAPGDTVHEGEPIAEVQTDKVDMDLESPFAGTIVELLATAGSPVELGGVLATLDTDADDFLGGLDLDTGGGAVGGTVEAAPLPAAPPPGEPPGDPNRIIPASPPARKLARELGVDLAAVTPTGARGQIAPVDVRSHAAAGAVEAKPVVPAPMVPKAAPPVTTDPARRLAVRRATAQIMTQSATIPQFTLYRTLQLDRAAGARQGRSWTTELVRAMAGALRAHPELNMRWDADEQSPMPWDDVRVGLAVDRPGTGLVVAAIAGADTMPPAEADALVRTVADRARTGKLRPVDMAQASITLSNLGGLGVERFNALLFPPQAAILSVGTISMRPIATPDGALKAVLAVEVGLTIDHRVADGADGARFLATFAEFVEA